MPSSVPARNSALVPMLAAVAAACIVIVALYFVLFPKQEEPQAAPTTAPQATPSPEPVATPSPAPSATPEPSVDPFAGNELDPAKIKIINSRVAPYAQGHMLYINWRNDTGKPVSQVYADAEFVDKRGTLLSPTVESKLIFDAEISKRKPIPPGATYTEPAGAGYAFVLKPGEALHQTGVTIRRVW